MIAANVTDALLSTSSPAARAEEIARAPLATAAAWDLELSYPGALVRTNVCWAHLLEGNTRAARAWIEPITRSGPTTNTAFAHLMLAAVELREGHAPAALRRSREADEHIRIHDQNWTMCLPWAAEIELWAGRASDTCPRLDGRAGAGPRQGAGRRGRPAARRAGPGPRRGHGRDGGILDPATIDVELAA